MPMTSATRLSASAWFVERQNKNPNKKRNADLTPVPQKFVTLFHINRGLDRQAAPEGRAEMMHRLILLLACGSCLGVVWGAALGSARAAPEPKPNAGPVCLYESKTYSKGAFVCVQKSLMLTCMADGDRVSWKPVPDRDINERCTSPTVQYTPAEPRLHAHRRHYVVRRIHSLAASPAKCFIFNGAQYCE
jgi:hypothetical protein